MKKELALGMMRLPTDADKKIDYRQTGALVDYFLEQGFRRFDTAEIYHNTMSEVAVRECIVKRYPREAFEIADKLSTWRIRENSTAEEFFNTQLKTTGLEYFDRYLLHSVEERLYPEMAEKRCFDFIFEKNGKKYTIHSDGMKIKNYGDFFSLVHDKRLVSLLPLVKNATIDKTELEHELSNYDDCRPVVIKLILDFEKLTYNKYPDILNMAKSEEHFDFGRLLEELVSKNKVSKEDTWTISQIRIAFSHNIYPKEGVIRIKTLPEIAKQLIVLFQDYTADI
jgi:hypothetical protein